MIFMQNLIRANILFLTIIVGMVVNAQTSADVIEKHNFYHTNNYGSDTGAMGDVNSAQLLHNSDIAYNTLVTAISTPSVAFVDNKLITLTLDTCYIDDVPYVKLRDIAYLLNDTHKQFELGWDANRNAVVITTGLPYTAVGGELTSGGDFEALAIPTSIELYADNIKISFIVQNIVGNNYYPLVAVLELLDVYLFCDITESRITIDTTRRFNGDLVLKVDLYSIRNITLSSTNSASLSSIPISGDFIVNVNFTKNVEHSSSVIIFALYDDTHKLLQLFKSEEGWDFEIEVGKPTDVSQLISQIDGTKIAQIKVFIWSGAGSIEPLANAGHFPTVCDK